MDAEKMSPEELAKWMQNEHTALMELNKVLRQHIAAIPEVGLGDWIRGLSAGFDRLRAHLARHFAAKEADGYLTLVVEHRPTLSKDVEQIRREHDEIIELAEHIQRDLSAARPETRLLVADVCARVQRFMAVVAGHDEREAMITMLACNLDIGGTD